jgi:hypothetical protein
MEAADRDERLFCQQQVRIMDHDTELLTGVSIDELEALAAGMLVPTAQSRLEELMASAEQHERSPTDSAELDDLLHKVD